MENHTLIRQKITLYEPEEENFWNTKEAFRRKFIPSNTPLLNKESILCKSKTRPAHYFSSVCVMRKYCKDYDRVYYTHSIQLFYAKAWSNFNSLSFEFFQRELFNDICKHLPDHKLKQAQSRRFESTYLLNNSIKPKLPDVWMVDKYPGSLFIKVKRMKETLKKGQKEGLGVIRKFIGCDVLIERICSELDFANLFGPNANPNNCELEPIVSRIFMKIFKSWYWLSRC